MIARSQLVEIGGGFRIPDVMKQSGAKLVEVGTTNRVHARIMKRHWRIKQKPAGLVLRAHSSNFRIIGFTTSAGTAWIWSAVAHAHEVLISGRLGIGRAAGYGAIMAWRMNPPYKNRWLPGSDLVCFSGDKLLGGPQAGIIVGTSAGLIEKIKKHPWRGLCGRISSVWQRCRRHSSII